MAVEVKFCGMTRPEDAAYAASLGADYVGVIFAGGPRHLREEQAAAVLEGVRGLRRVGVFANQPVSEILSLVDVVGLDVVQLHGTQPAPVAALRASRPDLVLWRVLRMTGAVLPADAYAAFDEADAVLLEAKVEGRLGGTGIPLDWPAVAEAVAPLRNRARLVLAGGLTPENVTRAVDALVPDVVDVSSGVERSPGVKDHARMRAFREAVDAWQQSR